MCQRKGGHSSCEEMQLPSKKLTDFEEVHWAVCVRNVPKAGRRHAVVLATDRQPQPSSQGSCNIWSIFQKAHWSCIGSPVVNSTYICRQHSQHLHNRQQQSARKGVNAAELFTEHRSSRLCYRSFHSRMLTLPELRDLGVPTPKADTAHVKRCSFLRRSCLALKELTGQCAWGSSPRADRRHAVVLATDCQPQPSSQGSCNIWSIFQKAHWSCIGSPFVNSTYICRQHSQHLHNRHPQSATKGVNAARQLTARRSSRLCHSGTLRWPELRDLGVATPKADTAHVKRCSFL